MNSIAPTELDHCSELALLPGSLFEFTSRFLAADQLEPLLALYALKQSVSTIPHSPVDDLVKWAKLKWWSEEFTADPVSPSRHPVLRALWRSGARDQLNNDLLQRLISNAIMQIDAIPNRDEIAMFERFAILGSTEIQLELALENADIDKQNLNYLGAASSLSHVLSGFTANRQPLIEQIPLNVLAKYNLSAAQLEQQLHPVELTQIIVQLAETGLEWFSKGLSGLVISPTNAVCTHLQLRWAVERRHLAVIKKNASKFVDAGKHYGPADAWFAWRLVRRLRRP